VEFFMSRRQAPSPAPGRTAKATETHMRNAAIRAVDDPVKLAWAARVITTALERGRINLADLTPQGTSK
jgi:hypothetical protein